MIKLTTGDGLKNVVFMSGISKPNKPTDMGVMRSAYAGPGEWDIHKPENADRTIQKVLAKIESGSTKSQASDEVQNTSASASKPRESSDYEVISVVSSLQEKLSDVFPSRRRSSIFKVPTTLRNVKEEAYTPQIISIGPYHHGSVLLKSMEEHKLRYLADFFRRGPKFGLQDFVKGMRELEMDARPFYEPIDKGQSDAFVEMLILDGCFIVELFFKYFEKKKDVLEKDPIFHIASMIPAIRVDMLLLENQLPLFILEFIFKLFSSGNGQQFPKISFLELALGFFNFKYQLNVIEDRLGSLSGRELDHFLDVMRECILPPGNIITPIVQTDYEVIPSATELHKAGVKFRRATTDSIFNLHFTRGVLEMPALLIQDSTEVIFRNLIAFEQCSRTGEKQFITHYLALMDFLINSPDDVATLRRAGIIHNWLGDDEQVSQFFNKIFIGVTIFAGNFYFKNVTREVNTYYNTPWHSFRAMLGRDYFYSPWSTASSIAVIIVVLSTIIQAVCSVYSLS